MLYWATFLYAIDPEDGELKKWQGPHVPGITYEDAKRYIHTAGLGYLTIYGQLITDTRDGMDPYLIRMN
jgi:hypothetical protein